MCIVFAWYGSFTLRRLSPYVLHAWLSAKMEILPLFAFRVNGSIVGGALSGKLMVRYSRVVVLWGVTGVGVWATMADANVDVVLCVRVFVDRWLWWSQAWSYWY